MVKKLIQPAFWVSFGAFILVVITVLIGPPIMQVIYESLGVHITPILLLISGTLFFLSGLTVLILTVKADIDKTFKRFLILTGASAVGVAVSMILHNAIYGLFIYWFGSDFWDRIGLGDEPFFFFMVFVCLIAYLVGSVGSITLMFRRRQQDKGTE